MRKLRREPECSKLVAGKQPIRPAERAESESVLFRRVAVIVREHAIWVVEKFPTDDVAECK